MWLSREQKGGLQCSIAVGKTPHFAVVPQGLISIPSCARLEGLAMLKGLVHHPVQAGDGAGGSVWGGSAA